MDFLADPNRIASALARLHAIGERAAPTTAAITVSFEFFPPTDPEMESLLWTSVRRLGPLAPRFVSVTYGADGSTRDRTLEIVSRLRQETTLPVAPHVTSIGSSRESVRDLARAYWSQGINHLVALRGDAPGAIPSHTPGLDEFRWGLDLVRGLRSVADFEISVAAYPEVHPEAKSPREDLDNLRRKVDAGATRAITQFFFDNSSYLRFRDDCVAAGITVPIVPGILPILRFSQVQRFARRCGARIPESIATRFEGLDDDADTRRLIGAAVAIEQVEHLRRHGVTEFHFYTLNRSDLTYAICHAIGVRATKPIAVPSG
jgi:methylenetetrahydrofolate reductase (NADPH)